MKHYTYETVSLVPYVIIFWSFHLIRAHCHINNSLTTYSLVDFEYQNVLVFSEFYVVVFLIFIFMWWYCHNNSTAGSYFVFVFNNGFIFFCWLPVWQKLIVCDDEIAVDVKSKVFPDNRIHFTNTRSYKI